MVKNKIKSIVLPFSICLVIALALYPDSKLNPDKYSTKGLELDYNIKEDMAINSHFNDIDNEQTIFTPFLGKSFEGFKEAIAFKESRGDYFTVNTLGYLGKYQFGSETLKTIGIYRPNSFLHNPELQEKAFLANA